MQYRRDIDGLRAIAVLLVVLFHVHPHQIKGGFIGVDVFFVISGFLITKLICSRLRDERFSLWDFYARRIRRIFPALALVLATCVFVGWFVLFPADYRDLGKHAAASAAFVVNFTLLMDAGYFAAPSELNPLLHLWSLGVEEQFYILWPTLVLLAWRWRHAPIVITSAILAASFGWSVLLSRSDPAAAFFLPTTRFWELMVGCVLALGLPEGATQTFTSNRWFRGTTVICDTASLLGMLLVVAGATLINSGRPFPGWWALLPTMGTALLIAAGPGALVNRHVLSRPIFVQLGLISYPLYLWHWPILAFMRHYHLKDPSDLMRWGGIALAILLASWTYRIVEKPIRHGAPIAIKAVGAAFIMALIGCAGVVVFGRDGLPGRFPKEIAALLNDNDNAATVSGLGYCAHKEQRISFSVTRDCEKLGAAGGNQIVVWGDSHAAHLARGLIEIERARRNVQFLFFTTGGCPPIPSFLQLDPRLPNCTVANQVAVDRIRALKPNTVILAANWARYDGNPHLGLVDQRSIREVVHLLKSLGIKRIIGIGQFPLWYYAVPKIIARYYRRSRASLPATANVSALRSMHYIEPKTFTTDQKMRRWFLSEGAVFVSPLSTLCNENGCLLNVPGHGDPIDRDQSHLTNSGSIWFATKNAATLIETQR